MALKNNYYSNNVRGKGTITPKASKRASWSTIPGMPKLTGSSTTGFLKIPEVGTTGQGGTAAAASQSQRPVDPGFDAKVGALRRRRDDTVSGLGQERDAGLSDAGYTGSFDAKGEVTGLSFDPNNPFSRAALLKRNYDSEKSGNKTSYAARGQLYSGALVNQQNTTDFNRLQGDDALQKRLREFLGRNLQARKGAQTDFEFGSGQALSDSVTGA